MFAKGSGFGWEDSGDPYRVEWSKFEQLSCKQTPQGCMASVIKALIAFYQIQQYTHSLRWIYRLLLLK